MRPKACRSRERAVASAKHLAPLPKADGHRTWWDGPLLHTCSRERASEVVSHPGGDSHGCVCLIKTPGVTGVPPPPGPPPAISPQTCLASPSPPQPSALPTSLCSCPKWLLLSSADTHEGRTGGTFSGQPGSQSSVGAQGLSHHSLLPRDVCTHPQEASSGARLMPTPP